MFNFIIITSMVLLSIWAIINILIYITNKSKHSSQQKYFWQMNAYWNAINLMIAILSLISLAIFWSSYQNQKIQEIIIWVIAVNMLLDLCYVGAGLLLEKRPIKEKYKGWGVSIQLQGAFLFFFDTMLCLGLLIAII